MNINDHRAAFVEMYHEQHTLNRCPHWATGSLCERQADALLASPALARLLAAARDEARAEAWAGAGDDHGPVNCVPTPEQLLRRMADGTAAERLAWAERAIHNSEKAHDCFLANHRGRIAHLERQLRATALPGLCPAEEEPEGSR